MRISISENRQHQPYIGNLYTQILSSGNIILREFNSYPYFFVNLFKSHIIHLHWPEKRMRGHTIWMTFIRTTAFVISLTIVRILGKKIVTTAHNLRPHIVQRPVIDYTVLKLCFVLSNAIITHSNHTKMKLIEIYRINPSKVHVIGMGSTMEDINVEIVSNELGPDILKIDNSKYIVSILGNLSPYKGIDCFLETTKLYLDKYNDAQFILAGRCDPGLVEFIKQYTDKYQNIVFINRFLTNSEYVYLLQKSNVGMLPFHYITDSSSLEQYLFYEIPVITRPFDSLKEIARDFVIYESSLNPLKWEKYLDKLLHTDLGSNFKKKLSNYHSYSWNKAAYETVLLYFTLLY